ncbi:hypothetical protein PQR63_14865 [Herbaspirillum rhizosphaerae]|uniref:BHLH domain-containing protein n=1 Tax=Herbaspirillum rhizosphaerae TaxID=346179 RepID=A0ABW8Z983_9BURK
MQTTAHTDRPRSVHSSGVSAQSIQTAQAAHTANTARATSSAPLPYQPSQPHVLTDDLKAQLAQENQRRRANLYPRLAQTLATIEPSSVPQSYSEQRAMSLQELAAANKARRNRLREAGYAVSTPEMA